MAPCNGSSHSRGPSHFFTLLFAACLVAGALMRPARGTMIWRTGRWIALPYLVLTIVVVLWKGSLVAGLAAPFLLAIGGMFFGVYSNNNPLLAVLGLSSVLLVPLALVGFCQLSIHLGNWLRAIHDERSPTLGLALAVLILAADGAVAIHLRQQYQAGRAKAEAREEKREADRAADQAVKAAFLAAIPMQTFHGTFGSTPIHVPASPQVSFRFACDDLAPSEECFSAPWRNPGDLLHSDPHALPPLRFTEIRIAATFPTPDVFRRPPGRRGATGAPIRHPESGAPRHPPEPCTSTSNREAVPTRNVKISGLRRGPLSDLTARATRCVTPATTALAAATAGAASPSLWPPVSWPGSSCPDTAMAQPTCAPATGRPISIAFGPT